MDKGKAVPFILIQEHISNKQVEYSFKIHPEAHDVFNSDAVKNKKVAIAAIAGPQRTGKSFLSNRLLKRMNGFAIGPSTMPCTKGLWIWGEPIKISEDTVLIIMDTEGLNSVQRDINVDMKIFSLSILLSSVFIYNSIGHIDEKALENMSYVLRISENIKVSADSESQAQMSKYFPYFYWVLRDFSLDLKGMSQNEYLNESLKPISQDEKDPRNQIRTKIRKLFAHRRCECFPRPVNEEDKLAHIEELQYEQLRQSFKQKMKAFEQTFFSNLPPKTINNKPITGAIYLNLAYQYVNAMNNGKIPKIMNSFESVIASQARKVCDTWKHKYKNAMDEFMRPQKMPIDENEIDKTYRHYTSMLQQKINEQVKIWGDVKVVQDAKKKLFEDLATDLLDRKKENSKLAEVAANKSIIKLFESVSLPELTSPDMITVNLVSQKQQQFEKKYDQFMQNNKAPMKYEVFSKKYPKFMFDYFGKLVARVKGVFSDQLKKLNQQSQNRQAEIESLKRIMKQQNETYLEKERQLQSLTIEKQQFQRQYKKISQLTAFQKQSQKMSKNDIKKTLQETKKQLLQCQCENQQLTSAIQRLKNENSTLKMRPENPVETRIVQSNSNHLQQVENLPTELAYMFIELRGKLSVMNEFYDKKAKDQTIDEYMNRQIEEYRNDKYESIQKIKEEMRKKIEHEQHKYDKMVEMYEKQLGLINTHLDFIKNENIELRKQSADNPDGDKKAKQFVVWKKKFQQSLRIKQNHLNSQILNKAEKQRQIQVLKRQKDEITDKFARVSAEKANLDSYKGSLWYLLRESLNYSMNKGNKLRHAMKSLDQDDQHMVLKTFNDVGIKYS